MLCKAYKKLVIIAIQEKYLTIISNQIKEIFGDVLSIRAITVKDIAIKSIHTDELVLLSGEFILQIVKSFLPDRAHFVIAKRSLNFVISYLVCIDEKVIRPNSLPFFIKAKEGGRIDMREISKEVDEDKLISEIERHGFLEESIAILEIFNEGKKQYTSYGRTVLRKLLEEEKGIKLSNQQLRLRLEVLNNLNLLIVRRGRSGTTISREGEKLFYKLNKR